MCLRGSESLLPAKATYVRTYVHMYAACTLVLLARLSQFASHLFTFTLPTQLTLKGNWVTIFLGTHMYTHVPIRTNVWDCLYIHMYTHTVYNTTGTLQTIKCRQSLSYQCTRRWNSCRGGHWVGGGGGALLTLPKGRHQRLVLEEVEEDWRVEGG